MRRFLFLVILIPFGVSAQTRIGAYLGANFPSASEPFTTGDVLADYWHPAINVGAYSEFSVLSWLEVSPLIEYNHYIFDKYQNTTQVYSVKESSGEASRVLRIMIETRLVDHAVNGDRAYLVTGVGYVAEKIGDVNVRWGPESGSESSSSFQFPDRSYWVHSLGIGYQFDVAEVIALDLCAKYYSNYKDRFAISTNVGVVYSLHR